MANCCGFERETDQLDVWNQQPSSWDLICTKPIVYGAAITALAVAILGAFSLLGFFYPSSGVGVLGELLGDVGAYSSLVIGLAVAAALIASRCHFTRARRLENAHGAEEIAFHQPSVNDFYEEK